ncbi:TPA: hypothetical protein N0F65_008184 [Lagenidium giganteum]|uniref:Uncharacterized protein n=1 Tax=Lagenidium giganteum TaxID=4803 RepID=A0AAV2YHT0_9STRA|nr:TPA: hypothetical protein N0F65_008184 [Lagenidium giganteum]
MLCRSVLRQARNAPLRRRLTTPSRPAAPSNAAPASSPAASGPIVSASTTPGTVRFRRAQAEKDMDMDSTIARIMGSDWGDRSKQPVSYAMRVYWVIFSIVFANGVYTYVTGKDESYLVDKLQQKVDEKRGIVEMNEFVVMADKVNDQSAASEENGVGVSEDVAPSPAVAPVEVVEAKPAAMAPASSSMPTTPPPTIFSSSAGMHRPKTKDQLHEELTQLRLKQERLKSELRDGSSFRSTQDLKREIHSIDEQKTHLKQLIKKM